MRLTAEEVRALGERGWFTREAFLGRELALAAYEAARGLAAEGALRPAGLGRSGERRFDRAVRGDEMCWLGDDHGRPALAAVRDAFEALRAALREDAWLPVEHFAVQLARYPGDGSGYERHLDAFPGQLNRVATAICYLNPGWAPAHGGSLRVFEAGGEVDVEPRLDRLVVLLSERVPHAVLPAFVERFAVAAWYRGRDPAAPALE